MDFRAGETKNMNLNKMQRYAATRKEGNFLVLSGAGTGKTTILTNRVANLIEKGVSPDRILLLTFTRKAATEMINRVKKKLQMECNVIAGTFHSIALQYIMKHKKELGYKITPSVIDADDAKDLIDMIKEKVNEDLLVKKGALYNIFSKSANTQKDIEVVLEEDYPFFSSDSEAIKDIYSEYIKYKREKALLDFDDLLLQFLELARLPKMNSFFKKVFKYVMVDEFQDTNNLQMAIIKEISNGNLMVVGDEAQCWDGDCTVSTSEGLKKVFQLGVGDLVECYYGGIVTKKPVTNVTYEGVTSSYSIVTDKLKEITVSKYHRCFVKKKFNITKGIILLFGSGNCGSPISPIFVRYGKETWRFEKYKKAVEFATHLSSCECERIQEVFSCDGELLTLIPAYKVKPGMHIPVVANNKVVLEEVVMVNKTNGAVYDVEVEDAGNMAANQIITHNSCYSFRGANFKNIMDFPNQFDCETIIVSQNYRSNNNILTLSNSIIESATEKFPKELFSNIKSKHKPNYVIFNDPFDQAIFISSKIKEYIKSGVKPNNIAVLFRNSRSANALEAELTGRKVKYIKYGGMSFLDSAHIKDIISILRVCSFPHDPLAWHRTLQMIPGVGKITIDKLVHNIVDNKEGFKILKTSPKLENLDALIQKIRSKKPSAVTSILNLVLKYYMPFFETKFGKQEWRKYDIESLKTLAETYANIKTLINYLTIDPNNKEEDSRGKVILSTIHSDKGLEHEIVFIMDLIEEFMPSKMARNSSDIEEERRLFYIAATRAKDTLFMCAPFGKEPLKESRFVREIKPFYTLVSVMDKRTTNRAHEDF